MNPSIFFDNFSLLADSPNGAQKLREMILQLAVMGKLVPQNPNDEPASVLLEKMKIEMKENSRNNNYEYLETKTESSLKLPKGWECTLLSSVSKKITDGEHFRPKTTLSGVYFLSAKDVRAEGVVFEEPLYISEEDAKIFRNRCNPEKGDILVVSRGATVGRSCIINTDEYFCLLGSVILIKLHPEMCNSFVLYALKSSNIHKHLTTISESTAQQAIYIRDIKKAIIPLPPLEEQKRIVAKVDQLMTLCDELEALHQHRNESRVHLNNAAINKLLDAGSANEFNELWQLIYNNFDLLYDNLANVAKLRQTILQLAVMGKLVSQDPNDEPAGEVLNNVCITSAEVQSIPAVEKEEIDFNVPKGWVWERLGKVIELINGKAYKRSELLNDGTPIIRIQNLNGGNQWYYSNLQLSEEKYCENGDLLFAWSATFGPYIWEGQKAIYHYHIWKLNLKPIVYKKYVYYLLEHLTEKVKSKSHGLAMLHFTKMNMEYLPIPLPPLEEQKRIVVKVDQLMTLCDELEVRIRKSQEDGGKITNAIVSNLTAM